MCLDICVEKRKRDSRVYRECCVCVCPAEPAIDLKLTFQVIGQLLSRYFNNIIIGTSTSLRHASSVSGGNLTNCSN